VVDIVGDVALLGPSGWAMPVRSILTTAACTRPLIESRIRARVLSDPRIHAREGCDVVGLVADANRRVIGVQIRERGAVGGGQASVEKVRADLVVDASGRNSRAPQWLQELGYQPPAETIINSFLGYASVTVEPPADFHAPWKGVYVMPAPPDHLRGGAIWPVEGGRWMITLAGMAHDYPPTDEVGFMTFAERLRTPVFHQVLQKARPLSPIVGHRATENRLRHYERMASWPDGFVVLGDAACAFNPVYGQGMTIATMSAQVLDACLHEQHRRRLGGDLAGMGRRFQRWLARNNATAWQLATGPDLRGPATEGARPTLVDRLMYRYLDRIFLHATVDSHMTRTLLEVLHLSKPPSALFHPRIVGSLLRGMPKAAPHTEALRES
jgi:2-polyprenyl-6-methoxyphenol hydroxylase-like FAD-dependent oxidoreductase